MLPKGIIFDLDDTIITFEAVAHDAWRSVCEYYARKIPGCQPSCLFDAIEEKSTWYWSDSARHKRGRLDLDKTRREIVRLALGSLGIDDCSLAGEIADKYSLERDKPIRFLPGAEETLEYLASREVRLVLITNGEGRKQREKIERFRLERFFNSVLIEGEIGFGKPEERIYRKALEELGLTPEEVWSVGDNLEWDVSGPQKIGVFGIWHDYRDRGVPPGSSVRPDRVITSIPQLIE